LLPEDELPEEYPLLPEDELPEEYPLLPEDELPEDEPLPEIEPLFEDDPLSEIEPLFEDEPLLPEAELPEDEPLVPEVLAVASGAEVLFVEFDPELELELDDVEFLSPRRSALLLHFSVGCVPSTKYSVTASQFDVASFPVSVHTFSSTTLPGILNSF
jgi:hypothetical protein